MGEILLSTINLGKTFGEVIALEDINIQAKSNSVLGLIGSNGAGKTTFIKCCCGLTIPSSGSIMIGKEKISQGSLEYLKDIGAVLEGNRNIYHNLTILENLHYFGGLRGLSKKVIDARSEYLLELFDLKTKAHTQCGSLSRGMQQKVSIICALLHQPKILFLDEPTLGLDYDASLAMKQAIREIVSDDTVIIVTSHDLRFISDVCTELVVIQRGKIIYQGDVASIRKLSDHSNLVIKITPNSKNPEISQFINLSTFDKDSGVYQFKITSSKDIYDLIEKMQVQNIEIENITQRDYALEDLYIDLNKQDL